LESLRILIVDDQESVRRGIRSLLASRESWIVCGEAADGLEGVEKAKSLRPDIVLMDLSMPVMDGVQAAEILHREVPQSDVVLVSQNDPSLVRGQAAKVGAAAYVAKSDLAWELLPALDRLAARRNTKPISGGDDDVREAHGSGVSQVNAPKSEGEGNERQKAERANSLLAAIVDSSDDAIISKSLDGIITSWNKAAERIFGHRAEEAIGKHITLIIPADRRDEEAKILQRLKRGERIDHFETIRVSKGGKLLDISLTISPVKDGTGAIIGASKVARDVTERKRIEKALRASEERFKAIVQTTPECVKLVAFDGTLLYMNPPGLAVVGAERAEMVVGKKVYDLIAPHDRERFRIFNEEVCGGERGALEFDIVALTGASHHMETHAAPLQMEDGSVVQLAVTRDITERTRVQEQLKQSQERLRSLADDLEIQVRARTQELEERNEDVLQQSEQLRELSSRLQQTQDDERRHIARELHDSAGQIIAALGMNLASMTQHARKYPVLDKTIDDSQNLVQQLNKEIRTTSYLLHPPLLDDNGLPEAIRWYAEGLTERSNLRVELNIAEDFGRLPNDMELAMFRVVQECLTNIHRHSGSKTAMIRLSRRAVAVALEIEDGGCGIPTAKLDGINAQRAGVGIAGMRERIRHFKGVLSVHSDSAGTRVSVILPILPAVVAKQENTLQEHGSIAAGIAH
jgi:PAS domain S-box-containing protein